jgi:hypothetical protein
MLIVRVDERSHQQHERGNGDQREYAHRRGLALGLPIDQTGRPTAEVAREARLPKRKLRRPADVKKGPTETGVAAEPWRRGPKRASGVTLDNRTVPPPAASV